ncbi:serpentine type 7TM GPCR chemoreceptor str domain-containing protein [Ditylenchus destructor]|uniref:Serpentine type 7TM GPCR chemoreceptor str domain-containing protein n=1 Tax=Ditylenchus destructor TaxID=166010 RepID=A0AAD4MG72_9BILA|nr:serpentine type 7TM GPCR chemoreceptor str domain-containing protein [Ditylenchus destructor]
MTPGVDDVHHIMETTVYSTSTVLNIYLLYLITYHSTFGIKLYKYLLTVDAGLDLIFGFIVLLSQPVAFTCDGYFVMKLNGFVAGFSPASDTFFATIYVFFLHSNILWIPVQFFYRYLLLCKDSARSLKANILIAAFTILYSLFCLVIFVAMCEVREEYQTVGKHIIEKNGWPMRSDGRPTYVVGSFITEWRMMAYLSIWLTTSSFSIVTVVWCEKNITKYFREMGNLSNNNNNTQRMHSEFHRALLAMAICPLIAITIPVYYFCTVFAFQLCSGWISAYITSALSAITVINPLTTIFCFRCYRRAALKHFTCDQLKKTIRPSNSIAAHTASNTNASEVRGTK